MKKLSVLFLCITFITNACGQIAEPSIIIIPHQCKLKAGEEFPISLEGTNMPASAEVTWSVTKGILDPSTGFSVIYTAPQEPGSVIITAILKAESSTHTTTLTCEVSTEPTITVESTATLLAPSSIAPADTIAITEVMSSPCGGGSGTVPNKNEYIELYNFGSTEVDVMNWWLATNGGGGGTPDNIVPWNFANPGISLGNSLKVNESIIPPGKFAVILSPMYSTGEGKYHMPYTFPEDTILLSFSSSRYLGNDTKGLVGNNWTLTTIVLYKGSEAIMSKVVSTYGTPVYGSSPNNVEDDKLDNFPYPLSDCRSMERIDAAGPDVISNWRDINMGNPGEGDYDGS